MFQNLACSRPKFRDFDREDRPPSRGRRKRKHVPHRLRSKEFVRRRNNRERRRVQGINAAFEQLRQRVPHVCRDDRASKISILRLAGSYILALTSLLQDLEDAAPRLSRQAEPCTPFPKTTECTPFPKTAECTPFPKTAVTCSSNAATCSSSPLSSSPSSPSEGFVAEGEFTNRILKSPCASLRENRGGLIAEGPNVLSLPERQHLTDSRSFDATHFELNPPAAARTVKGLQEDPVGKRTSNSAKPKMMSAQSPPEPFDKSALTGERVLLRELSHRQPHRKNLGPGCHEEDTAWPPSVFGFGPKVQESQVPACGETLSFVTTRSPASSSVCCYPRTRDLANVANAKQGQVNLPAHSALQTTKCRDFLPGCCQFQHMREQSSASGVTPPGSAANDVWQETVPQPLRERSHAWGCFPDTSHPDLVAMETGRQDDPFAVLKCACAECRRCQSGCTCVVASAGAGRLRWLAGEPWQVLSAV